MNRRNQKLAKLLQKELSDIILYKLNDPRIGFMTITNVILSSDLQFAKVQYSIIDYKKENINTLNKVLKNATSHIRFLLKSRIKIKYIPELKFEYSDGIKKSYEINMLIEKVSSELNRNENDEVINVEDDGDI